MMQQENKVFPPMYSSFPGGSVGKESACNAGDMGLIPEVERCTGEGNGNLLQYSCLGNSMGRGAWWATIHGVTKSWTRLSDQHYTLYRWRHRTGEVRQLAQCHTGSKCSSQHSQPGNQSSELHPWTTLLPKVCNLQGYSGLLCRISVFFLPDRVDISC